MMENRFILQNLPLRKKHLVSKLPMEARKRYSNQNCNEADFRTKPGADTWANIGGMAIVLIR